MKPLYPLRDTQRVSSAFEPECAHPLCRGGMLSPTLAKSVVNCLVTGEPMTKTLDYFVGDPCPICARRDKERLRLEKVLRRDRILYIAICCALTVLGLGLALAIYLVLTRI